MYRDHAGGDAIGAAASGGRCIARSLDRASFHEGVDDPLADGAWNE
jgi:hypothetical protein